MPSVDQLREERFFLNYVGKLAYQDCVLMTPWQRTWHIARLVKQREAEEQAQREAAEKLENKMHRTLPGR